MTVIKVQSPLFTNSTTREYQVYDQLRARRALIPEDQIPYVVKTLLYEHDGKWFFEGEWDQENETWKIGNPTHWRDW